MGATNWRPCFRRGKFNNQPADIVRMNYLLVAMRYSTWIKGKAVAWPKMRDFLCFTNSKWLRDCRRWSTSREQESSCSRGKVQSNRFILQLVVYCGTWEAEHSPERNALFGWLSMHLPAHATTKPAACLLSFQSSKKREVEKRVHS